MQFLVSKIKNNMLGQNHRLNVTNSVGPPKSWPMGLFNNCVYSKIQVLIISFPNNYNFVQVKHVRRNPHRATQHFACPRCCSGTQRSRSIEPRARSAWCSTAFCANHSSCPLLGRASRHMGWVRGTNGPARLVQIVRISIFESLPDGVESVAMKIPGDWMNICLSAILVVRPGDQGSRVSFGSHTHVQRHTKKTWRCWMVPLRRTFVAITAHSARKVQ